MSVVRWVLGMDAGLTLSIIGLLASLFALYAKWQESPRLEVFLKLDPCSEGPESLPQRERRWRFAHIHVRNPQAPVWVRWLAYRQSAQQTRVLLEYFALDGTRPLFHFEARWSGNREPTWQRGVDGRKETIYEPWYIHAGRFRNISSGDGGDDVAVAIKLLGDEDCYGFTNESYEGGEVRVLQKHRLPKGSYIVVATAIAGQVRSRPTEFLLYNGGPALTDLRIDLPKRRLLPRLDRNAQRTLDEPHVTGVLRQ